VQPGLVVRSKYGPVQSGPGPFAVHRTGPQNTNRSHSFSFGQAVFHPMPKANLCGPWQLTHDQAFPRLKPHGEEDPLIFMHIMVSTSSYSDLRACE
jgi:hypothetical protein